jgi:hypothetical protein
MKVKPNTKEQLVDFMLKHLSLGTYDKKFLDNIVQLNFTVKNPVTTNQAELLDKITSRYHRQFLKKELNSEELIQLPWTLQPIESSIQFTQAYISIADDKDIVIHSPYKKEFVKTLKALEYMQWDKENKLWHTPYAEFRLKKLLSITKANYSTVNYCPIIEEILVQIKPYEEAKYWSPTLIKRNDNYYVVACNKVLYETIKDIELNDNPATIARLVRLGINIDIDVDSFAKEMNPQLEVHNVSILIESLQSIDTDFVILNEWRGVNKEYMYNVANHLKANKIKHSIIKNDQVTDFTIVDLRKYEMPVKINLGMSKTEDGTKYLGKTINLVNSTPIEIK